MLSGPAMTTHRHVAVWIDHREARVFHVDAARVDEHTLRAPAHHIHRHPKGGTADHAHPDDLHDLFEAVTQAIHGAERVLIVGPSTAKLQLLRWVREHDPRLESRIAGVESVDHPTDAQLVAYAKRYFVADDRKQGHHVEVGPSRTP